MKQNFDRASGWTHTRATASTHTHPSPEKRDIYTRYVPLRVRPLAAFAPLHAALLHLAHATSEHSSTFHSTSFDQRRAVMFFAFGLWPRLPTDERPNRFNRSLGKREAFGSRTQRHQLPSQPRQTRPTLATRRQAQLRHQPPPHEPTTPTSRRQP